MTKNSEISFLVDTLLVETILAEPKTYKQAGFVSDLLARMKEYFSSKIDPNNPTASVINELAPGVLWLTFKSLGIGKFGLLLSLLMSVFHVDVYGMLSSLHSKIKSMLSGSSNQKISSEQIDSAVNSTIQEHSENATEEEAQAGYKKLQNMPLSERQPADDNFYSSSNLLSDAKIINLALIDYDAQNFRLMKSGVGERSSFLNNYSNSKAKGTSLLGRILGWIVKVALASAGLMVAGDVVNKVLGRPNSLDRTYKPGQEQEQPAVAKSISTQTKYPTKGDAPLPKSIPLINNPANIDKMLIQFTKDVYSGLDNKDDLIRSAPGFQAIKEQIAWYNVHNEGSALTFIPSNFQSKKQLVDYFIDDVAKSDK